MKKLLLFTLCVCMFGSVKSQTLLSENFDNALNWTVSHTVGTSTNAGWTQVSSDSSVESNSSALPFSGAGMAKFDSYLVASNNSYSLTSPVIAFNGASYTVKFRIFLSGQSSTSDQLNVYYNTNNTLTGATLLGSVQRRLLYSENQPGWHTYIYEIPGTPTGNGYISFVGTSGYNYSFDIDEVVVGVKNTCTSSNLINVSSVGNDSGFATWTNTGASGYEYVVDNNNGDPLSSATKITTSSNFASLSGLASNTLYFLHVRSSCSAISKGEWKTIAFKTLEIPVNDICANAVLLTPSSRFDNNYTTGTTVGSNTTSGFSTVCSINTNSDVWYKAVVPASGSLTFETDAMTGSTLTNTLIGVYSGTCGSLNLITCNGNTAVATNYGKATITGRTPGEVVYVGVWNTGYSTTNGEFKIEAYDASLTPANDLCAGAVTLTKGTNFVQSAVVGSTFGATTGNTNLSCNLSGTNDVWYKVVVPASGSMRLETQPVTGSNLTKTIMGIYSGTCNSLIELACSKFAGSNDNFSLYDLTGRTPGEVLYLNVYAYNSSSDGEFKIAAYDIPTPLVNDNCSGAITLTAGNNFNTNAIIGTTLNATSPAASTSCGANFDVWYKTVIPASGSLTIETESVSGSTLTDTKLGVFSGSCGVLTDISCNDDKSQGNTFSKIYLTGRTPGETIYIAVYNYSSDIVKNGEFKIAAYDIPTPVNDNCSGAIALTAGNNFNTNAIIGTTLNAISPAASTSCGAYFDVWYKTVIPASGSLTVETESVSGSALTDTKLGVFSGSCGALTNIDCNDDKSAGNIFSKISLTGRTPGETIYIAVYNYYNDSAKNGEFKIAAYDASITLATDTFDLSNFSFYPNPVEDILNLNYSEPISTVEVVNVLGQTVLVKNGNSNNTQIDLSSLTSGTYIVRLTSGSLTQTIKIIKK